MIEPDLDEAARFLRMLDRNGRFVFQIFAESPEAKAKYKRAKDGRDTMARTCFGKLDQHERSLADKNAKGVGVFVTINETHGKSRKADNVTRVRALFADIDGTDPAPAINADPPPHIVVESSPDKFHCYWIVRDCRCSEFSRRQGQISVAFGSDPKPKDLPRVMRLPGFVHHKGDPFRSRIVQSRNLPPYSVADLKFLESENGRPLPQSTAWFAAIESRWAESDNWRTMKPLARDLFSIALSKYNGRNNGDISLALSDMAASYPWWSKRQTLDKWRQYLVARGWLIVAGHRGKTTLYAVSVRPIDDVRHPNGVRKLAIPPTKQAPDTWKAWRPGGQSMSTHRDIDPMKADLMSTQVGTYIHSHPRSSSLRGGGP